MALTKTFFSMPRTFEGWSGVVVLPIPEDIAAEFKTAGVKRFICVLNDEFSMPCALHSDKNIGKYIMLSKRVRSAFDFDVNQAVQVKLTEDDSEFGHPVPEEWQAILEFDEEAAAYFADLTPGKQRSILHMVGAAKREETRINRALKIAENLKLGIRNPQDFLKNH